MITTKTLPCFDFGLIALSNSYSLRVLPHPYWEALTRLPLAKESFAKMSVKSAVFRKKIKFTIFAYFTVPEKRLIVYLVFAK